jgi:hypothetical protein
MILSLKPRRGQIFVVSCWVLSAVNLNAPHSSRHVQLNLAANEIEHHHQHKRRKLFEMNLMISFHYFIMH